MPHLCAFCKGGPWCSPFEQTLTLSRRNIQYPRFRSSQEFPQAGCDIQPCAQPVTCAIMVEAAMVGRSQIVAPLSPLLSRFEYLSSWTSAFCGEFSVMVQ